MPGVYEVSVTLGEVNWVIKIDFRHGKIFIADKYQAVEVDFLPSTPDTRNTFALFGTAKFINCQNPAKPSQTRLVD